jgi:hypothetical protein
MNLKKKYLTYLTLPLWQIENRKGFLNFLFSRKVFHMPLFAVSFIPYMTYNSFAS